VSFRFQSKIGSHRSKGQKLIDAYRYHSAPVTDKVIHDTPDCFTFYSFTFSEVLNAFAQCAQALTIFPGMVDPESLFSFLK
jgi:hypothetical protein